MQAQLIERKVSYDKGDISKEFSAIGVFFVLLIFSVVSANDLGRCPTDQELDDLINFSKANGYMPGVDDQDKNLTGPLIITDVCIVGMAPMLIWTNKQERRVGEAWASANT